MPESEQIIEGLGVSPGVVCAPWPSFVAPIETSAGDPVGTSVATELDRARSALDTVAADLETRAGAVVGGAAEILRRFDGRPVVVRTLPALARVRAALADTEIEQCRAAAGAARAPQAARKAAALNESA
ncbi:hypothetical protein GV794_13655 [Nocardia cyriacigeorgica]|uniref:Uncharacterized protein n=1 Tax=Nocardia cyriacigeorgica TaxID=135487 RepID=A0A6P1D6H5_9NOCA|nr:hypothetical protein [Nocardia cyriacigeorgica]NEW37507.1 hypothetical protein [Nocardia cyriacigeorgica]NEW44984.1 hypothetical protein [Nocardia cyriacigeorgica]NEW49105.1 hypothetical protein [Nocardia cyriacigeorgica]NEW56693.1 hypothetical protein [Nocardia cyriacigeorgica]